MRWLKGMNQGGANAVRVPLLTAVLLVGFAAVPLTGCDYFVSPEQRIERAHQHVAAGDDRAALIELQSAVRAEPSNVAARLMLTDISLRMGQAKTAAKELDDAVAKGATTEQAAELRARIKLALGEFEELRADLDAGKLALSPADRHTYAGLAWIGSNKPAEAIAQFRKALAIAPDAVRARIGLAEALGVTGEFGEALQQLQPVIDADPANALAWLTRGLTLIRQAKPDEALAALAQAREHSAGRLDINQRVAVLASLTEAYLLAGNASQARIQQAELAKGAPDSVLTNLLAARISMAEQNYAQAAIDAQKVVTAAPDYLQARLLLGAASFFQGNYHQADAHLGEVLRRMPENVEARKLLAQTQLKLQRPDLAAQLLAPLQQPGAEDADVDALLGWASLQRGERAAGVQLLERSAAAQPGNQSTKLALASAYVSSGQHEKAIELLKSMPSAGDGGRRREALLISAVAIGRGEQAARAEMDRMVAENPHDVELLNLAAALYSRGRDFDRARALLKTAIEEEKDGTTSLLNLARVEVAAGATAAARQSLQRALQKDRGNQAARFALAQVSLREGDAEGAIKLLQEMRAADPKAIEPRLLLARVHLDRMETAAAENIVREAIEGATDRAAVLRAAGRLYAQAGRYDAAVAHFRDAVKLSPRDPAPLVELAGVQLALADPAAARATIERALELRADDVQANSMMAKLDVQENRAEQALKRVATLRAEHPGVASIELLQGEVAIAARQYALAIQAYDAGLRLQPSSIAAVGAYRARHLAGQSNATAPLEAWLERNPEDRGARMVLAEASMSAGASGRAIKHYERLAGSAQPDPTALNNLAWLYAQAKDPRALDVAKRAYEAAPKVAAIGDTYGWILLEAGRIDQALPILRQAAASQPVPQIRYHYAAALARGGQHAEARRELEAIQSAGVPDSLGESVRKLLEELGS